MDPLDAIESLARLARTEQPPPTNVNIAAVLRSADAEPPLRLAPFAWSAAVSALAAGIILSFAIHTRQTTSRVDSITPLFNAIEVQMP
jgi:hypothetical protein